MEQNKRKHMCSIIRTEFEDKDTGPAAALGCNFYVKKVLGTTKYFRKFDNFYHEIPKACLDTTIQNSRSVDTDQINANLRRFNAQQKR
tara:strand:- start:794 stop:1057 length:264 start_codon:yes stop_codon:yes gene_type:complete